MATEQEIGQLKRIPLEAKHVELGGKMVPFGGFYMPVQYTGIKEEHQAVRQGVGLFDVSHMGEIEIIGRDAIAVIDRLVTNDVTKLVDGQALYTVMCTPDGGIVDDLLVYRLGAEHIFLCVNASTRDKDFEHIIKYASGEAMITHRSEEFMQFAVQGPRAVALLESITSGVDVSSIKYFFAATGEVAGVECLISRTGYTGEDGFEVYVPAAQGAEVFDALVVAGSQFGMLMCGLGCRDTLRLEAKLHLYGQDMDDATNPLEAGLGWVVKLNKASDFVGKEALQAVKAAGVKRKLVGLVVEDRGIIRHGYEIFHEGVKVGEVTSGSYAITLEKSIGLGYIDADYAGLPQVDVMVRKNAVRASTTNKPFYARQQG
jgi:aminomethyltransferase